MPANAEAKMKNSVMARSLTASAERLKLLINLTLLSCRVHYLSLVEGMDSECHHLFADLNSAGQDGFLLPDRGNLDRAKRHPRLVVHHPKARSAAAIMHGTHRHPDGLAAGTWLGDQSDRDRRAERYRSGFTFEHVTRLKGTARRIRRGGELAQPRRIPLIMAIK